jgi:hypothetical protein
VQQVHCQLLPNEPPALHHATWPKRYSWLVEAALHWDQCSLRRLDRMQHSVLSCAKACACTHISGRVCCDQNLLVFREGDCCCCVGVACCHALGARFNPCPASPSALAASVLCVIVTCAGRAQDAVAPAAVVISGEPMMCQPLVAAEGCCWCCWHLQKTEDGVGSLAGVPS